MIGAWVWRLKCPPFSSVAQGNESEPDMVGGPGAALVAKAGLQERERFPDGLAALRLFELVEERPAERPEPTFHAGLERRRARHEHYFLHGEAGVLQQPGVFLGRREEPGR